MDTPAPPAPTPGVLLVNLGSPVAPTPEALACYLQEFLSDPRVVDWPRWLWMPILKGIILRTRPPRSAALYQKVWTDAGPPLVVTTRAQAAGVAERLGPGHRVAVAMRYGVPPLADGIESLAAAGCDPILVVPLFPQESTSTTDSVRDVVDAVRGRLGDCPRVHVAAAFPDDAGYIDALATTVREDLAEHPADHLVFSFHGIPKRYVKRGDPYEDHCRRTATALATALELDDDAWTLVFQSKFGPEAWLQPYADQAVPALAERYPRVSVACPGFPADCLETIDEIGRELADDFVAAGGESLRQIPCLNAHPRWLDALTDIVRRALAEAHAQPVCGSPTSSATQSR